MTRSICVIPARMGSSRFPGKPLEKLVGLPLILHVWERCRLYSGFERVVVATCDEEIREACAAHGAEAVMTKDVHERATDRVEEAIDNMKLGLSADDFVLMVQGDEILVTPEMIATIIAAYEETKPPVVNLVSPIREASDHDDVNVVKIVAAPDGRALYLSRAPIPSRSRAKGMPPMWQQTGVIGFSADFLKRFSQLPQTPLEKIESVDMLRVLENGLALRVVPTAVETIGVDTPDDLKRAEKILAADALTSRYLKK